MSHRTEIFKDIIEERARQDRLHPEFPDWDLARLPILMEEVGEVAKDIHENNLVHLRQELIETIAVGVRWVEAIDKELEPIEGAAPQASASV